MIKDKSTFMHYRRRHHRYRRRLGKGFFFLVTATGAALFTGLLVMLLWNAILPPVTGVHPLAYWQAVGLLLLCRLLFGRFPRPPFRRRGRAHWREKWKNMPPEERERLRRAWQNRCGRRRGDSAEEL